MWGLSVATVALGSRLGVGATRTYWGVSWERSGEDPVPLKATGSFPFYTLSPIPFPLPIPILFLLSIPIPFLF